MNDEEKFLEGSGGGVGGGGSAFGVLLCALALLCGFGQH